MANNDVVSYVDVKFVDGGCISVPCVVVCASIGVVFAFTGNCDSVMLWLLKPAFAQTLLQSYDILFKAVLNETIFLVCGVVDF